MKKAIYILIGLCAGALLFGAFSFSDNWRGIAEKNNSAQWEYSSISAVYIVPGYLENPSVIAAGANICYLKTGGCQIEEVKSEVEYSKYLQDYRLPNTQDSKILAYNYVKDLAFAKAVAKLGLDGWELVGTPSFEFDQYVQNPQGTYSIGKKSKETTPNIYFKRLKN